MSVKLLKRVYSPDFIFEVKAQAQIDKKYFLKWIELQWAYLKMCGFSQKITFINFPKFSKNEGPAVNC